MVNSVSLSEHFIQSGQSHNNDVEETFSKVLVDQNIGMFRKAAQYVDTKMNVSPHVRDANHALKYAPEGSTVHLSDYIGSITSVSDAEKITRGLIATKAKSVDFSGVDLSSKSITSMLTKGIRETSAQEIGFSGSFNASVNASPRAIRAAKNNLKTVIATVQGLAEGVTGNSKTVLETVIRKKIFVHNNGLERVNPHGSVGKALSAYQRSMQQSTHDNQRKPAAVLKFIPQPDSYHRLDMSYLENSSSLLEYKEQLFSMVENGRIKNLRIPESDGGQERWLDVTQTQGLIDFYAIFKDVLTSEQLVSAVFHIKDIADREGVSSIDYSAFKGEEISQHVITQALMTIYQSGLKSISMPRTWLGLEGEMPIRLDLDDIQKTIDQVADAEPMRASLIIASLLEKTSIKELDLQQLAWHPEDNKNAIRSVLKGLGESRVSTVHIPARWLDSDKNETLEIGALQPLIERLAPVQRSYWISFLGERIARSTEKEIDLGALEQEEMVNLFQYFDRIPAQKIIIPAKWLHHDLLGSENLDLQDTQDLLNKLGAVDNNNIKEFLKEKIKRTRLDDIDLRMLKIDQTNTQLKKDFLTILGLSEIKNVTFSGEWWGKPFTNIQIKLDNLQRFNSWNKLFHRWENTDLINIILPKRIPRSNAKMLDLSSMESKGSTPGNFEIQTLRALAGSDVGSAIIPQSWLKMKRGKKIALPLDNLQVLVNELAHVDFEILIPFLAVKIRHSENKYIDLSPLENTGVLTTRQARQLFQGLAMGKIETVVLPRKWLEMGEEGTIVIDLGLEEIRSLSRNTMTRLLHEELKDELEFGQWYRTFLHFFSNQEVSASTGTQEAGAIAQLLNENYMVEDGEISTHDLRNLRHAIGLNLLSKKEMQSGQSSLSD